MIVEVSNVPLSLDAALPANSARERKELARALGVAPHDMKDVRLLKRSVDARKKSNVHFVAAYAVEVADGASPRPARGVSVRPRVEGDPLFVPDCAEAFAASGDPRPLVVGMGPAGLFAALYLARAGLRPLVVERGQSVEERTGSVERFDAGGPLDVQSNIQFGEGGAGTFSDGKLTTGTKSPHIRHVLEEFAAAGAPQEILWQAKPHIGTDKLVGVVRALRESIVAAGGEVRFNAQLVGLETEACGGGDGLFSRLARATVRDVRTGEDETFAVRRVVLACGHSARDTFQMMCDAGAAMERKPFAVGVRIEHPQKEIDRIQYGKAAGHPALGAADYKLAVHTRDGRGVYTFCMCPGGEVVAAASEEGGVCVNGMSRFARDGRNANSALLVSIGPDDLPGDDAMEGVAFQRALEQRAFCAGKDATGEDYAAPAQTVGDFLAGRNGRAGSDVAPTYPRAVAWVDLHEVLPPLVTDALEEALPLLDAKMRGFAHPDAVLTAVEARSSSPVRIVRDDSFQARFARDAAPSRGFQEKATREAEGRREKTCGNEADAGDARQGSGLYPCGEGAGYAGGIMSAAVDGLRVAEALARAYAPDGGGGGDGSGEGACGRVR